MPIEGPTVMEAVISTGFNPLCNGRTPALLGGHTISIIKTGTFSSLVANCAPEGAMPVRFQAVLMDLLETDETQDMSAYTVGLETRLEFRSCQRGEFIKEGQCVVCPLSTYSLEFPVTETTECRDCTSKSGVKSCQGDELEVANGYWRRHDTSVAVLTCPDEASGCEGGIATGDGLCEEGYEGPLCAVCSDGYYFSSGVCEMCGEDGVVLRPAVITFLCIAAVLSAIVVFFFYSKCIDGVDDDASDNGKSEPTGTLARCYYHSRRVIRKIIREMRAQIKIVMTTYQIVSTIPSNLSVEFPESFVDFLRVFSVFNLNVISVVPFSCQRPYTFIDKLVFTTLFPVALAILLMLLFVGEGMWNVRNTSLKNPDATTRAKIEELKNQYLTYFFFLTYLVLPSVSTTIFQTFLCTDVDPRNEDSDKYDSYLIADMNISCTSDYYKSGVAYAIFMLLVYVVGIPTMYFVLLYMNREEIMHRDYQAVSTENTDVPVNEQLEKSKELVAEDPEQPVETDGLDKETDAAALTTPASVATGEVSAQATRLSFLWDAYEPQYWYWEIVETTRRLVLTAVLSVCGAGSAAQSVLAIILSIVYIKLYGYFAPYERDADDVSAEVGQYQIFFTFLGALIYQKSLLGSEWNIAVSIALIIINSCVGVLFTYYSCGDLVADLRDYKDDHWAEKDEVAEKEEDFDPKEGAIELTALPPIDITMEDGEDLGQGQEIPPSQTSARYAAIPRLSSSELEVGLGYGIRSEDLE